MLRRLSVENYVLIDKLEMELDARLNIITGETGAGKSILLGALGLLLGNKNDGATLRDTSRNCVIEGVFDLSGYDLQLFFEENDLDYDPECIVRRVITPAGKSRAYINDLPVQLALLRSFGGRLIDIHSQHQNLILGSERFRIEAVDTLAGNRALLDRYAARYDVLHALRQRLDALRAAAEEGRRDEEWLRYQVEELTAADLRAGELAEAEAEFAELSDADRIGEALTALRNLLDDDEMGVLLRLKGSENDLAHLRESYPRAAELCERLHSTHEELKDISALAAAESERIEADPERLQRVGDRINTLYSLCQKHRAADVEALIELRDRYAARLSDITHSDEEIAALEAEIAAQDEEAKALARELHEARAAVLPLFERRIAETLARLGMPDTTFRVTLEPLEPLSRTGGDRVEFLFSANRNVAPQPVDRIASGGELSRVMLALKALLAERMQLPTIIFDEIDTGVSGRIADAMGEIISSLSATMQVVDITHLPQVASKGDTHFLVYKRDGETNIRRLDSEARMREIATMLSGSEITDAALEQARILLSR